MFPTPVSRLLDRPCLLYTSETYLFQELARRRARQHVPEGTFVHFDTPLTLAHELSLLRQAGFTAEVLGYRGEDNTPMIRAIKP